MICDAFPTHGGFQFSRSLSHPDKRRLSHKQRSQRTCEARRIRLRRMRLAAAYAAAICRPAPVWGGRRAAHFSRVMLSYPLKPFLSLGICTIYPCGVLPNADILQTLRKPQCMLSPHTAAFNFPDSFRTTTNAAFPTNSAAGALARRAAFGFAECGWRRLTPPPHASPPLRGESARRAPSRNVTAL